MPKNKITVIFGKKGSGKSYLINQMSWKIPRIILLDPLNDFKGGYIFYNFPEFQRQFRHIRLRTMYRIVLKFTEDSEYSAFFDYIFNFFNLTIAVDEADLYAPSQKIDPGLKKLLSYGRHREISQIYASRRPYELNRLITALADEIITFRQTEYRDLDFMSKLGFNPNEIKNLGKYQYLTKSISE